MSDPSKALDSGTEVKAEDLFDMERGRVPATSRDKAAYGVMAGAYNQRFQDGSGGPLPDGITTLPEGAKVRLPSEIQHVSPPQFADTEEGLELRLKDAARREELKARKLALAKEECALEGHMFYVVTEKDVTVECERCGAVGKVTITVVDAT